MTLTEHDNRIMSKPLPPICTWAEDSDGVWNASCPPVGDHSFCFTEAGPTENGFKFCPYCGKPLVASAFDSNAD